MTTRLVIKQSAELKALFARLQGQKLAKTTNRAMLKAAFLIQKDATENQIIRGGRFKRAGKLTSAPAHPTRVTSRTGELRRSIASSRGVDKSGLPRQIDVGSDLAYAGVHEYGLRVRGTKYPMRAFMKPALNVVAPKVPLLLVQELERATRTL